MEEGWENVGDHFGDDNDDDGDNTDNDALLFRLHVYLNFVK